MAVSRVPHHDPEKPMGRKNASASAPRSHEKVSEALGLLTILGALFVIVSLATYNPSDFGYGSWPPSSYVQNKGGPIGATLADFLYRYLGIGAYAAALMVGAWGGALFFRMPGRPPALRLVGSLLALYATAVLFSLQPMVRPGTIGLETAMPSLGGAYGDIGCRALVGAIGPWGAFLAVLFTYGLALVLSTKWLPHQIVKAVWKAGGTSGSCLVKLAKPAVNAMIPSPDASTVEPSSSAAVAESPSKAETRAPARPKPAPEDEEPAPSRRRSAEPAAPARRPEPTPEPVRSPSPAKAAAVAPARSDPRPMRPVDEDEDDRPAPAAKPQRPSAFVDLTPPSEPKVKTKDLKPRVMDNFTLPPIDLFEDVKSRNPIVEDIDTEGTARKIEEALAQFNIPVQVKGCQRGPIITEYYIEPGPGVKVNRILSMCDDIAIALRAPSVRIVGPIPGKGALAVEVPNPCPEIVRFRSLLAQTASQWQSMPLPLLLGKDAAGRPIVESLAKMPHCLVAGTTGSGKSVCLNTIITSLLVSMPPTHLKMLLVDPKMVELSIFKGIPHLWAPVMTDMKNEVPKVLEWLCQEMDNRYMMLSAVGSKNIEGYNKLTPEQIRQGLERTGSPIPDPLPDRMPYIVCVIDEFAELMNVASKEVTSFVQRLAQKARAIGIHVVLATQHPSTDVVLPEIKANFPARIAFQVSSGVNSRVVLDRNGAERLLGKGDMLYIFPGMPDPLRGQGTYLDEKEVLSVVDFLKKQGEPQYHAEILEATRPESGGLEDEPISDEMFDEAVRIVLSTQRGSTSLLQRRLNIGFSRAGRLIDLMAQRGIVGDYQGSKAREVLMTVDQWEGLKQPAAQAP
jgi:S-DNA-T family DNA segregation ATPase FtsK/SpoIIIE